MGGFLGLGHTSAKTDRGNQLAGINAEWNVYNRGLPAFEAGQAGAGTTRTAALGTLDQAKAYWQNLMNPTRTDIMQTASPAINAIQQRADAQQRELGEMGTNRGGGVNAASQQLQGQEMGDINNILGSTVTDQRAKAAQGLTQVGAIQGDVAGQQMREALQALGLSKEVADEIIDSSIRSRPISEQSNAAVRQQWSNVLGALGF